MTKKPIIAALFLGFFFCPAPLTLADDGAHDLVGSVAHIPGLIETANQGVFVDFLKELEPYTGGKITLRVFPFTRSVENAVNNRADFHFPFSLDPSADLSALPYRPITEKCGSLAEVIYSNSKKPITKKMIQDALASSKPFPYRIEVSPSFSKSAPFPHAITNTPRFSLKKVEKMRIDAFFWAQEEIDFLLRKGKKRTVHRELWGHIDDTFIVAKTPRGERADRILSEAIRKMRSSGKFDRFYSKVHAPYDPWQPHNQESLP